MILKESNKYLKVQVINFLQVSDLTICLDRRGALGKIEVYQDPLLYR